MADRRQLLGVMSASLLALVMVAVSAEAATHTVMVEDMRFDPAQLTVKRGDRVLWINKDMFPHTVIAGGKAFDSGDIAAEKSWTYVAVVPGRHSYSCTYHPGMKGTLIVQ